MAVPRLPGNGGIRSLSKGSSAGCRQDPPPRLLPRWGHQPHSGAAPAPEGGWPCWGAPDTRSEMPPDWRIPGPERSEPTDPVTCRRLWPRALEHEVRTCPQDRHRERPSPLWPVRTLGQAVGTKREDPTRGPLGCLSPGCPSPWRSEATCAGKTSALGGQALWCPAPSE